MAAYVEEPIMLDSTGQAMKTALEGIKEQLEKQTEGTLPLTGGTLTGPLNAQNIYPDAGNLRTLGNAENPFLELFIKYINLGGTRLDGAGFHNSIYRGKNITSYYTDGSLWDRLQGTGGYELFEDLYVGDYFTTGSAAINGTTKAWYWQIAGFDIRLGVKGVVKHHVVVVPCSADGTSTDYLFTSKMYSSTPFTAGYFGSIACQLMIAAQTVGTTAYSEGAIATGLKAIFGSHILPSKELLSTVNDSSSYNRHDAGSGASTSWGWISCYATLLSEVECYGSIVWTSSGYDGGMDSRGQLPLFRLNPSLINHTTSRLWLRSVTTGSLFAKVDSDGYADDGYATGEWGLRPRFLIA